MRHVALIGNNLENYLKTVGLYTIYGRFIFVMSRYEYNHYVYTNQIQQEQLIKHDDSWIIITNRSTNLKFKSPMAPTSLVKFTSWDRQLTDGIVRVKIFVDFIMNFLGRMSKYRPKFNCHLSSDGLTLQNRKEIEDVIRSVCIDTRNCLKHPKMRRLCFTRNSKICIRQGRFRAVWF